MSDKSTTLILVGIGLVLMVSVGGCTFLSQPDGLKASITSPKDGDNVSNSITVSGTSEGEIPENMSMWLLIGEEVVNQWWPQGGSRIAPIYGKWSKKAMVGGGPDSDIGKEQQIVVILVDEKVNKEFKTWVETGINTSEWKGLELPQPPSGTVLDMINVVRKKG